MWKEAVVVALSCALSASYAFAAPDPPKCRGNRKLVGSCFTIHGRMREANGARPIRIWRIGTDRVLGAWEPSDDPDVASLPKGLEKILDEDHQIFADFIVCPLTKERDGEMQTVCVESATRIVRTLIPPSKKEW